MKNPMDMLTAGPAEAEVDQQAQVSEYERSRSPEALRAYFPNSPSLFAPKAVDTSQDAALREAYPNSPALFARGRGTAPPSQQAPSAAKGAAQVDTSEDALLREAYPSMFPAASKSAEAAPQDASAKPSSGSPPAADALADLQVPEGIDPNSIGDFRKVAGELGLDAPRATKLLQFYKQTSEARNAAQTAAWEKAGREDQEFGGAAYEKNLGYAVAAAEELGGPEAAQALREAKAMHPTWFRVLARIGRALEQKESGR